MSTIYQLITLVIVCIILYVIYVKFVKAKFGNPLYKDIMIHKKLTLSPCSGLDIVSGGQMFTPEHLASCNSCLQNNPQGAYYSENSGCVNDQYTASGMGPLQGDSVANSFDCGAKYSCAAPGKSMTS